MNKEKETQLLYALYAASGSTAWKVDVEHFVNGYRVIIFNQFMNFISSAVLDVFVKFGKELSKGYGCGSYYIDSKVIGGERKPCMYFDLFN